MRHIYSICAIALLLCACNQNEPKPDHQPKYPSMWSPAGHKYVSIDNDTLDGRYRGWTVEFFANDSIVETNGAGSWSGHYHVEYPKVYLGNSETAWFKFIDTLILTRNFEMSDCPTYKMVY